jgi:hypothetical protein
MGAIAKMNVVANKNRIIRLLSATRLVALLAKRSKST